MFDTAKTFIIGQLLVFWALIHESEHLLSVVGVIETCILHSCD